MGRPRVAATRAGRPARDRQDRGDPGETSVAIGDIEGTTSTTVWASTDRTHWQPLDSGRGEPRSGLTVIGLATLAGRFVAVTEMNDYLYRYLPPIGVWTSTDGQSWTRRRRCRSMRSRA